MHRFVYFVVLLSIIHLGLCSLDTNLNEEHVNNISSIISTTIFEPIVEDIIDNITELSVSTTTIVNEKLTKSFLTKYLLNVNQSSSLLSDLTFNSYLNDSILLIIEDHQIFLINKTNGINIKYFKYGNIIPIKQQSNNLVIYDDDTRELWIINSIEQKNSIISFKPKEIFISSSQNNLWVAETSDQLYISENSGINWKKIDDTSNSIVLGWSNKINSLVILQHSHYIKLLDLITYKSISISNDVLSAKIFSRYLLIKRLNINDSISISHRNNLVDNTFRSLPKRFQSQGNFYCAVEDIYTEDLLLLFINNNNQIKDNNETTLSTCNLISYSKQNSFSLSNINCELTNLSNTIECSKEQIPFYQIHGLAKNVYLANIGSIPTTVVSFDNGATWNKTNYECDKTMNCPNNASIIIGSLISSNDAPGIIIGKASDGINNYVAISSNAGRSWRLNFKGNNYLTAISNPNAILVVIPNVNQEILNNSFRYSSDYGRHWHEQIFLNEISFQILSLITDQKNIFYILILNNQNEFYLIQLDFNLLITERCADYQLKEWSLHNACKNGSKLYYKRRISDSHCLEENFEIRNEPCDCSLIDYECLSGYKRSKDGICLPKSHYTYTQDCTCNNTLSTKRRGYVKLENNQCINGIENYLSNIYITRRDPNHPNFFLYGIDSRTQRATIEIHTNDFEQNDDDEDFIENIVWLVDQTYEITALVFNENLKQVYMAVEHEQLAIIYQIGKNLRQQNLYAEQLTLDSNNELYKSLNEKIEYLTIDWLTQNLYVLVRNKSNFQQSIFILNLLTRKRHTIIKNQHIQPSILLIDPIKTDLYWISHNSRSILNIGNLQGEIKKQFTLNSNVNYLSYDPISHEIIYIINSTIYGLNTLDYRYLLPRIIYEHSSNIENPLFVHPILYFTNENNETNSPIIVLHAIDILAKSFAKNIAKFKNFNSLKLFIDMVPMMPTTTNINYCTNNPCSDICIPLEHEQFRCVCGDDAPYPSCSCPKDERFITGSCQAKNNQCARGRVLCQNRLNCAESARICEQDHTQYTETFINTARCTRNQTDDGFDCYYSNNTCIPFQWFCDGIPDCPLRNDEEHCHKLTTTNKPISPITHKCLTANRFIHIMCAGQCMRIKDVCRNTSNTRSCTDEFHLHCKQTHDKNKYVCKCQDDRGRCIAMTEACDDSENCERICKDSIHYAATSKSNPLLKTSSITWIILVVAILGILVIFIVIMTLRYRRRKNTATPSRTPTAGETADSAPSDTRDKLLNNDDSNVVNATS